MAMLSTPGLGLHGRRPACSGTVSKPRSSWARSVDSVPVGVSCAMDVAARLRFLAGALQRCGSWRVPLGASLAVAITTPVVSHPAVARARGEIFEIVCGRDSEDSPGRPAWISGSRGASALRVMWDKVDGQDQTLGVGLSYRF